MVAVAMTVSGSTGGAVVGGTVVSGGAVVSAGSVSGAAVSKHLSTLKEADLVRDTREGKFIYYELNASVLEEILLWMHDLKGDSHEKME